MQATTFEVIKVVLSGDSTLSPKQRKQILSFLKSGGKKSDALKPVPGKILRRQHVADRLNISLRTVDLWAEQGLLTKVKLPGRQRACGFPSDQVDAIARGEI